MSEPVSLEHARQIRFARALDRAMTVGDVTKINPMFRAGRDAGSISEPVREEKTPPQ